jgi:hypothetical protein
VQIIVLDNKDVWENRMPIQLDSGLLIVVRLNVAFSEFEMPRFPLKNGSHSFLLKGILLLPIGAEGGI